MPVNRFNAKLVYKSEVTSKTFVLVYHTESEVNFQPGQFFNLKLAEGLMRAYSVVDVSQTLLDWNGKDNLPILTTGAYLTFLINTKPGGTGSQYFENTVIGAEVMVLGPLGRFILKPSSNIKNFVATGTGIAPFFAMIKALLTEDKSTHINLFFGASYKADVYTQTIFTDLIKTLQPTNFNIFNCITKEENKYQGRVNQIIPQIITNFDNHDFYLCGNGEMINTVKTELANFGVQKDNIHFESFGG